MIITINEKKFSVGVLSLKRNFTVEEKYRVTTLDGKKHREVRGVYKSYTLTLGNINEETYDELVDEFTSTDENKKVKLPYGKTGFTEFEAMFENVSDELLYERNGRRYWTNLTVTFTARETGGV